MDATFYDSLGQPKNAVRAPEYLVGDELGFNSVVATYSSGSIGNGTRSTAAQTLTITGDGVNYVQLEWFSYGPYISAGTAGHFDIELWDGTIGSGTLLQKAQHYVGGTGISAGGRSIYARVAPFTGTKTINVCIYNATGGSSTIQLQAGATNPMTLRATKLKGAGVYAPPSCAVSGPLTSGDVAQMPTSVDTQITKWQTELWDTHGMFSVNTNKITAPISGVYKVDLSIAYSAGVSSTATHYCYVIRYNSAGTSQETVLLGSAVWNTSAATTWLTGTQQIKMNAGDYLVAFGAQFTGGTRTFQSGRFAMHYVGPAVEVQNKAGSPAGWATRTTTASAAIGAGATSASLYSLSVTGDGVSTLELEAGFSHAGNSAGGIIGIQIWDGTVGSGLNVGEIAYAYFAGLAGSQWVPIRTNPVRVAPFTGTKTFNVTIYCGTAGTYSVHAGGTPSGNAAPFIKGTWV